MRGVLEALAEDLRMRGRLDVRESFIDGSFAPAKKGDRRSAKRKRGKGTKIMAVADCHGLPVAVCVESATPHEVKLATSTLVEMIMPDAPQNLIGDNAYDSDKLDTELRLYGIELIAPQYQPKKYDPGSVDCGGIADAGKLSGCLLDYRTSAGWSSAMNDTLKTFLEWSTSAAA